jgi:RNA polymerase sigma factor (TIGR02999 family)
MEAEGQAGPGRVTEVLEALRRETPGAPEELVRLIYGELHRLAAAQMKRQPSDHTLQPTALVHEAYLRLMGTGEVPWSDRAHFLTAAARAMRSVLVDFARRRSAAKRSPPGRRVAVDRATHAGRHAAEEVLAVHEALEKLERVDPQGSRVVQLRFFGGLTAEETARVLDLTERTVFRVWEHARSWLHREMAS